MRHSQKRFGLTLATTMAFALIGLQSAGAQDRTGFLLDADGMEPPDAGIAYALPATAVATSSQPVPSPELEALLADADGIEPPDCPFAVDFEAGYKAYVERQRRAKFLAAGDGNEG